MPNFAYTNNTTFKPFDYQTMLSPLAMATEAHQKLEEAYEDLSSKASTIGAFADETNDPEAYARYKAYESDLRSLADDLYENGLKNSSRRDYLNARNMYSSQIIPIEKAIENKKAQAEEQRKAALKDPTIMFERDFGKRSYESSLDRFLENPDYNYGRNYSGALLAEEVSKAAANLKKELSGYGTKALDPYTNLLIQNHGFTKEQVLDAINNPNRASSQPVLNAIVEGAVQSSQIPLWNDSNALDRAYEYARRGLWSAVGESSMSTYRNYATPLPSASSSGSGSADYVSEASLNYSPFYSQRIRSEVEKNYVNNKNNFSKYFDMNEDGSYRLNEKGKKALEGKTANLRLSNTNMDRDFNQAHHYNRDVAFYDTLRKIGYDGKNDDEIGKLWTNYINDPEMALAGYDAVKYPALKYQIKDTDAKAWKNLLLQTAVNGKVPVVEFDPKTEQFKRSGSMETSDLLKDDTMLLQALITPYGKDGQGNLIEVFDKDGGSKYIPIRGTNPTVDENIAKQMTYANELAGIPEEGIVIADKNGNPVRITKAQVDAEKNRALQSAQAFFSQLLVNNTTKPQTYEPFPY